MDEEDQRERARKEREEAAENAILTALARSFCAAGGGMAAESLIAAYLHDLLTAEERRDLAGRWSAAYHLLDDQRRRRQQESEAGPGSSSNSRGRGSRTESHPNYAAIVEKSGVSEPTVRRARKLVLGAHGKGGFRRVWKAYCAMELEPPDASAWPREKDSGDKI